MLPGSRHSEIRQHAEILASYANELALRHPNVKIFLPVTKDSKEYMQNYLKFCILSNLGNEKLDRIKSEDFIEKIIKTDINIVADFVKGEL